MADEHPTARTPADVLQELADLDVAACEILLASLRRSRARSSHNRHILGVLARCDARLVRGAHARTLASLPPHPLTPASATYLRDAATCALLAFEHTLPLPDRLALATPWEDGLLLARLAHDEPSVFECAWALAADDPEAPISSLVTLARLLCAPTALS